MKHLGAALLALAILAGGNLAGATEAPGRHPFGVDDLASVPGFMQHDVELLGRRQPCELVFQRDLVPVRLVGRVPAVAVGHDPE